jgi:hypothetical protein
MGWQKASGYDRRALTEAAISRFKRVIGYGLRSRSAPRQATEVAIVIAALNCMLGFGRSKSIRIVQATTAQEITVPSARSVQHGHSDVPGRVDGAALRWWAEIHSPMIR